MAWTSVFHGITATAKKPVGTLLENLKIDEIKFVNKPGEKIKAGDTLQIKGELVYVAKILGRNKNRAKVIRGLFGTRQINSERGEILILVEDLDIRDLELQDNPNIKGKRKRRKAERATRKFFGCVPI